MQSVESTVKYMKKIAFSTDKICASVDDSLHDGLCQSFGS